MVYLWLMKITLITSKTGETKGLYTITEEMLDRIKSTGKKIEIRTAAETDADVSEKLAWAEVLITSEFSTLNAENSKNLKWIHLTSAGTNKVPDFMKSSEIMITNSSGVHPIPISEHVFGLMLMLVRKIHIAHRIQIEQKKWVRSYEFYSPEELFGKTIIIVGMGRIGERIAKIAECFGMNVYGIVRNTSKKRNGHSKLFEMSDLPSLLKEGDFIVNCLPGTEHTKGIFDLKLFKRFKPSGYFINIGRGTSVVEKDMIKALETGLVKGAGLDVFEQEPLPETSPLWNLENVIITPHYSGWNPNYTTRVIDIFIENLKAHLKKEPLPNLVNKELGY